MNFRPAIPILRIFDEDKAREFYVDFLGFSVDWQHRFTGNSPIYQSVSLGECTLHLSGHHGDGTPGSIVRIETGDVHALQKTLLDKQYRYAKPGVQRQSWGMDEMTVVDPFNNRLVFYTPIV